MCIKFCLQRDQFHLTLMLLFSRDSDFLRQVGDLRSYSPSLASFSSICASSN